MRHFESNWQNKEGLNFYVQGWEPEQKPKGKAKGWGALPPFRGSATLDVREMGSATPNCV